MKKQKKRLLRLTGITAVVLSAGLWMLIPAWGQTPALKGMPAMAGMAGMGGTGTGNSVLTKDIAQARMATAKYATNLAKAQADGYKIITPSPDPSVRHATRPGLALVTGRAFGDTRAGGRPRCISSPPSSSFLQQRHAKNGGRYAHAQDGGGRAASNHG